MGQPSTMKDFRPMRHYRGLLQIETPLGIVKIRVRLTDHAGRSVDSPLYACTSAASAMNRGRCRGSAR